MKVSKISINLPFILKLLFRRTLSPKHTIILVLSEFIVKFPVNPTCDNTFVIYCLIEHLKTRKLKLFWACIDFQKAFDSVRRIGWWEKLLKYKVTGKILNVIKSMYSNIKSCVDMDGNQSSVFDCKAGLRQGENLSPILFSLFLNDLQFCFSKNPEVGLNIYDHNVSSHFLELLFYYTLMIQSYLLKVKKNFKSY